MTNLLRETIKAIEDRDFNWPADVRFITAYDSELKQDVEIPISLFEKVADCKYDNSYGVQKVDSSLTIVMNNGDFFTREEYNGSEWWAYNNTNFEQPENIAIEYNPFCE